MSGEYGGWGETFQSMSCIYIFYGFCYMWNSIVLPFFSILGSVLSIFVYSEQLMWSFHAVSTTCGILDPTKYTKLPFKHEYCVLALMDLVHLVVRMLFLVWDFHNKPIFDRQSQFDAKIHNSHLNSHSNSQIFFRFSSCLSLNSCGNQFPAFWTSPRLCKLLLTAISVTFYI